MVFLYNVFQSFGLILLSPFWGLLLCLNGRYRKGLLERMGIVRQLGDDLTRPTLWVHAASLGEVKVSAPVCEELANKFPFFEMVFSTSTPVGKRQAKDLIKKAKKVFLLPLDIYWVVRSVVNRCRPKFFLVAETELWPNLFFYLKKRGARIALFNGRISDRSFKRYKAFRFFFRQVLSCVDLFCMQTERDAEKVKILGAPEEKVYVTGNVKFDDPYIPLSKKAFQTLRLGLNLKQEDPVWVAGSVHPEEFPVLVDAFQGLTAHHPHVRWIVAPRHLYAMEKFKDFLEMRGLSWVSWDGMQQIRDPWNILLVDVLGRLTTLYQLGFAAFVGGSLAPIGGHNPLEPLRYGIPTLFGPWMGNFGEIREITTNASVAFEVASSEEIAELLGRLLEHSEWREDIREKCFTLFETYRGATERSIRRLEAWIRAHA